MTKYGAAPRLRATAHFDIDALLHPAGAFKHPQCVVNDPDLTLNEKRAILSSWASDACSVEAAPALSARPGAAQPVRFDDVMEALKALDAHPDNVRPAPKHYRKVLETRSPGIFGRRSITLRSPRADSPNATDDV
jgi:hypothetical protein